MTTSLRTGGDAEPRLERWHLDPVDELDAGPRVLAEEDVPVQVDVIAEWRDTTARSDAEPGLEHAAEHHAHAQGTCCMHHPDRLPDPARLGELDVDAVRDLRARLDVGERVAVLVDVDGNRRPGPQLPAPAVSGLQRLLAVLDPDLRE